MRTSLAEYEAGPTRGLAQEIQKAFDAIVPPDAAASAVAAAIVKVVGAAKARMSDAAFT